MGVEEVVQRDRARRQARDRLDAALAEYVDLLADQEPVRARHDSAELARLRVAHQVRAELAELGEHQVDRAIEQARRRQPRGHSWAEIGRALGISGQAAGKWARQRGLDTTRAWAPSEAAIARAERARAQRAITAAMAAAAARWPGRRLRRVDHDDGTVTFEPVSVSARYQRRVPSAPANPPPLRRFTDARDRALRGMAGAEVFRPELVRRELTDRLSSSGAAGRRAERAASPPGRP